MGELKKYLVGIVYHDPESWKIWKSGIIEDYESSTGVFIIASSEQDAIQWGEKVAERLFRTVNPDESNTWKSFGYHCWIEHDWNNSGWKHCLDFFQCVNVNEMPNIEMMGTDAYVRWEREHLKASSGKGFSASKLKGWLTGKL